MSHNDYTKYSKESKMEATEIESTDVEVVTTVTEKSTLTELPSEPTPIVEAKTARKNGYVFGCARLNVRNAPRSNAGIICEIVCDTEVEVDEQESTNDFYKICTSSGIEGYCVKSYISEKIQK